jgi:methyltransferase
MLTRYLFLGIVILVFLQRLLELRISHNHVKYILGQGGRLIGENLLPFVKVLQLTWFLAMIAEVWYFERPFYPFLAFLGVSGVILGQILRFLSMRSLEWRWTLPIAVIPNLPAVNTGIYRYLRHPNWLGVLLEMASLPLIHSAYLTAIVFSLINGLIMSRRVQQEELALEENNQYLAQMQNTPRFIPQF